MIDLSIIIVNWNTRRMLLDCIASIERNVRPASSEVIVVDNGSTDGSADAVRSAFPRVTVIENGKNLGFAKANNLGIRRMRGRYAVLLNSDTVVLEGAFEKLLSFMDNTPRAGMCGPQLLNEDGSDQKSFGRFPTPVGEFTSRTLLRIFFPRQYRRLFVPDDRAFTTPAAVDFIIGACMVARKQAIDEAGMLDEDYFFFYEEIDWCLRMKRAGWPAYYVPDARIVHFGGGSTKKVNLKARAESWRSRYLFFKKSLGLGRVGMGLLRTAGFLQVLYQALGYTLMNILTLFCLRRLRNRLKMFGYLVLWHGRGLPVNMCLPRGQR